MNQWQQIVFEDNTVVGVSLVSGGQAFGTGPTGGVAQNVYHAYNTIQHVWGTDREVCATWVEVVARSDVATVRVSIFPFIHYDNLKSSQ